MSGKLLSSADPSIRQLAVGAAITLTRAVAPDVSGNAVSTTLARSALDSFLVSSFDQFLSKKTCRIPVKIFDEIFSRFSDYSCTVLLKSLVGGIVSAKTLFLRSECCRILSGLLQRFKSLSKSASALIINNFNLTLGNVSKTLHDSIVSSSEISSASSTSDYKVKRMRPILQLAKDYIQLVYSLSGNSSSTGGKADENAIVRSRSHSLSDEARVDQATVSSLKQLTSSGSAFHDGKSSVLKRLAEQVVEFLDKLPVHLIVSNAAKAVSKVLPQQTVKSAKKTSTSNGVSALADVASEPLSQSNNKKRKLVNNDEILVAAPHQSAKKRK